MDGTVTASTGALRFVLGDQLSLGVSSLGDADRETDVILMAEVMDECTYVRHHVKKIAFLFSAMRHFAADLEAAGFRVDYRRLTDAGNTGSFRGELLAAVERHRPNRVVVTEPGEWRVLEDMKTWAEQIAMPFEIRPDDRFVCSTADFAGWATRRKSLRMEYFYREMRVTDGIAAGRVRRARGRQVELRRRKQKQIAEGHAPPRTGPLRAGRRHPRGHRSRARAVPGPFWRHRAVLVRRRPDAGGAGLRTFRPNRPPPVRRLSGRHEAGREDPLSCGDRPLPQRRAARSAGGVPPGRDGIPRRPRAPERRRGVHPPDHRLARIHPGHLLAEDARLRGDEFFRCAAAPCPASTGRAKPT